MRSRSLALSIVAVALLAIARESQAQDYSTYCLPQAQLVLGGVELGADSQTVRSRLGQPTRVVPDTSEGDGGAYPVQHLHYPHLQVDIGRNKVEVLSTTSPLDSLPSGVRVGMDIREVGRKLRLPNPTQYLRGDTLAPISCDNGPHSPDLAGVSLIFGTAEPRGQRRLAKIVLSEYGP